MVRSTQLQQILGADFQSPFPLQKLPHRPGDSEPITGTGFLWRYWLAYLLIVFLIVFWVPGNDFDTWSSYLVRVKLAEFGPLRETGTLELQYLFPRFFDFLHKPFMALGYFLTLPSFLLFLASLVIFYAVAPLRVALIATLIMFSAQSVMAGMAAMKNDLPLGAFALLAWAFIAFGRKSDLYPALCLAALCALIGTKWTGIVLAAPLGLYFLWRCVTERMVTTRSVIVLVLAIPLLWWISSAEDYLWNYAEFGTPVPKPSWYPNDSQGLGGFATNLYRFVSGTFVDTFDPLGVALDSVFHGEAWKSLSAATLNGKQAGYLYSPNSNLSTFGVLLLFVLGGCGVTLFRKQAPLSLKIAAATALFYTLVTLYMLNYSTWTNRYFIPAFIIGLLPTAYLAAQLKVGRAVRVMAIGYMTIVSLHVLLFNQERNLAPTWVRATDTKSSYILEPFYTFSNFIDRDRLYFLGWRGYAEIFEELRRQVQEGEGLAVINASQGGDVPFLYPFIMDRDPGNTLVINERDGQEWSHSACPDIAHVLTYKEELADPSYTKIYEYPGDYVMRLYERTGGC